ncbi:hypothetical protein HRR80_001077 [Exophiala dermatitidis]|uniref:Mucin n=2 Tax=Exophiala dermatitidis TaxID=5970 RepID=H6C7G2_EXODN|nr:uncharacterized protein HMPREF1120_07643 [Exophiala dermatitidis NIH/UT8656]KAJ4532899.1 hypothetical protein HRR76_007874 [Exophiala dermatitidis]EHY59658.1 hypothetical protein HMPREF1120_07643 [Exophiala dermatitidis NIH/UT8656]KAJ4538832.1 hypothetical protein HRR77_006757 [Exophiala dermatitidis]KAJ4574044.1 hypothetical protein HRR79_003046 [Exophiala dermatitidis]KAJ4583693.1 hypothetical protein HRR82_003042 [Exophiala dermatitidis]
MPSSCLCPCSRHGPLQARGATSTDQPQSLAYSTSHYFSSLERLRLAQDVNSLQQSYSRPHPEPKPSILQHPNNSTWAATAPSNRPFLLAASLLQPGLLLNGNKLRKRRASTTNSRATPSTVAWFASLPPALQKKLFSKEECLFYTQDSSTVILDSADEILRRRSSNTKRQAALEAGSSDDETAVDWEEPKHQERVDSAVDMGDYNADGFRWLDDEADLDLKLDDYHEAIAETARRTASFSEPVRRPFKRNTSLSSIPIRRPRKSTSSSRGQVEPASPPALPSEPLHFPSPSPSFTLKHARSQASLNSIDPRATHYQDPAARMKLRLYLASPQKFDEAIEFGFPSIGMKTKHKDRTRPMTSPQPRPDVNRTFFHDDDTPSLSGDDGDDADDPDTLFNPSTPEDTVFQMHRPTKKPSVDGNVGLKPVSTRRQPEMYARGGIGFDREMTLHMTLTRPDLRSPGETLPSCQKNVNDLPLERPELLSDGHMVSIWDTLPPEESRVKRFLRKLRLK